jgi:hypothetical protein
MLVYTDRRIQLVTSKTLDNIAQGLKNAGHKNEEDVVSLLIEAGMLESGICDFYFPSADSLNNAARSIRKLVIELGKLLHKPRSADNAFKLVASLQKQSLPEKVEVNVPEGYAYYGLFPQTFIAAAEQFAADTNHKNAVCIGIRSIGTSLSGAVAGTLENLNLNVCSFTLRPRGHPFQRTVNLDEVLKRLITKNNKVAFLIVDEGPGLSGSSLTCVANTLGDLGIPNDRIIFICSSKPDGSSFFNRNAAEIWKSHKKYVVSFESLYENGTTLFPGMCVTDLSAGKWRDYLYKSESQFPAINQYHERRKYLVSSKNKTLLAKFAGFKPLANRNYKRAQQLSAKGFSPTVDSYENGFLIYEFVNGTPLDGNSINQTLIDTFVDYLAFRRSFSFPNTNENVQSILKMIQVNVDGAFGQNYEQLLDSTDWHCEEIINSPVCDIDGRMLPHEWIQTKNGYLKTDSMDHCCDQFLPQQQDIAWDIAGICGEFQLDELWRSILINNYIKKTGDQTIEKRLPFYNVAYLSYRMGYSALSAKSLGDTDDAIRFKALERIYGTQLKKSLAKKTA